MNVITPAHYGASAAAFPDIWQADLRPGIPAGANIASDSSLDGDTKVPGWWDRITGEWRGFAWQKEWDAETRARWHDWPTSNVCLVTAKHPTLDIDVDDPEIAATINRLADTLLGPAHLRERDGSSRVARIYDGDIGRKQAWKLLRHGQRIGLVEALGVGQQVLVAGTHPSGSRYRTSLIETPAAISRVDINTFGTVLSTSLQRQGIEVVQSVGKAEEEVETGTAEPMMPSASVEDVQACLQAIPKSTYSYEDSYDQWKKVAMAVYASLGTEGHALWSEWASAEPEEAETAWRKVCSSPPNRIGLGHLIALAREHQPDFAPPSEQVQFMHFADDAEPEKAPSEPDKPEQPKGKLVPTGFSMTRALARPKRPWVLARRAMRGQVTVASAAGGVGKSTLMNLYACAVATGQNLTDDTVIEQGRVWIMNEDPLDELDRRFVATVLHHKLDPATIEQNIMLDTLRHVPMIGSRVDGLILAARKGADIVRTPMVQALIEAIRTCGVTMLIVDPFARTHLLDENKSAEMTVAMHCWIAVAEATNASIILVHHNRKGGSHESGSEDARGSGSIMDNARIGLPIYRMSKEQATSLNLPENDRGQFFSLAPLGKASMTKAQTASLWFQIVGVDLPSGENVGVAQLWTPAAPLKADPAMKQRVLDTVVAAEPNDPYRSDPQTKDKWVGSLLVAEGMSEAEAKAQVKEWMEDGTLTLCEITVGRKKKMAGVTAGGRVAQTPWD